jgi:DNA-binding protein HU-beta
MTEPDIDTLYPLVTEAIRRAEVLEDLNAPGARDAWRDVSRLEERIATLLSSAGMQGAIARRGAVRAAIAGAEFQRAIELADRFRHEDGVTEALAALLDELRSVAERSRQADPRPESERPDESRLNMELHASSASGPPANRTDPAEGDLMAAIVKELKKGGKFTLPGFGTFTVKKERIRNRTNAEGAMRSPEQTLKTVRFTPSPLLKKAI